MTQPVFPAPERDFINCLNTTYNSTRLTANNIIGPKLAITTPKAIKPNNKTGAATSARAANKDAVKETPVKPTADKPATPAAKDTAQPKPITYETIISN